MGNTVTSATNQAMQAVAQLRTDAANYAASAEKTAAANNAFNAQQAQIDRDWQAKMSSTAHQREVQDLIKAGLNPVLAANAGASTPSGSSASADTSLTSVFGQLATTAVQTASQMSQAVLQSLTNIKTTKTSAKASIKSSKISAKATKQAAKLSADASKWVAKKNYQTAIETALISERAQTTVASIAGQYNISATKLNNFVQQHGQELTYLAKNKEINTNKKIQYKKILTDKAVKELGIGVGAGTSVITSVIGLIGSLGRK